MRIVVRRQQDHDVAEHEDLERQGGAREVFQAVVADDRDHGLQDAEDQADGDERVANPGPVA